MIGIIGKKIGMTRLFDENGKVVPVTVVQAGPCPVLQVKRTAEKDAYSAVQIGFESIPERKCNKPMAGHFKKAESAPLRVVREFRVEDPENYSVGSAIDVSIFAPGDKVDVIGTSKGRGFAGAMKRHHSSRGPETHGSMYHRRPGSLGQSADPSHVFKGKPVPGHMGAERVTTQNIKVFRVDPEKNLILLRGAVPGHNNNYVMIARSQKAARKAARLARR